MKDSYPLLSRHTGKDTQAAYHISVPYVVAHLDDGAREEGVGGTSITRCHVDHPMIISLLISGHLMSKYNLEIAGGLGPTVGKVRMRDFQMLFRMCLRVVHS